MKPEPTREPAVAPANPATVLELLGIRRRASAGGAAGAARVITCNTVHHESNGIDLAPTLATNVEAFLRARSDEAQREAAHE